MRTERLQQVGPALVEETVAAFQRSIGEFAQNGLNGVSDVFARRLGDLDVRVDATEAFRRAAVEQVSQRQQGRRLAGLPRCVQYEVPPAPDQPEDFVEVDPFQRRDAVVPFGDNGALGVELAHFRTIPQLRRGKRSCLVPSRSDNRKSRLQRGAMSVAPAAVAWGATPGQPLRQPPRRRRMAVETGTERCLGVRIGRPAKMNLGARESAQANGSHLSQGQLYGFCSPDVFTLRGVEGTGSGVQPAARGNREGLVEMSPLTCVGGGASEVRGRGLGRAHIQGGGRLTRCASRGEMTLRLHPGAYSAGADPLGRLRRGTGRRGGVETCRLRAEGRASRPLVAPFAAAEPDLISEASGNALPRPGPRVVRSGAPMRLRTL